MLVFTISSIHIQTFVSFLSYILWNLSLTHYRMAHTIQSRAHKRLLVSYTCSHFFGEWLNLKLCLLLQLEPEHLYLRHLLVQVLSRLTPYQALAKIQNRRNYQTWDTFTFFQKFLGISQNLPLPFNSSQKFLHSPVPTAPPSPLCSTCRQCPLPLPGEWIIFFEVGTEKELRAGTAS